MKAVFPFDPAVLRFTSHTVNISGAGSLGMTFPNYIEGAAGLLPGVTKDHMLIILAASASIANDLATVRNWAITLFGPRGDQTIAGAPWSVIHTIPNNGPAGVGGIYDGLTSNGWFHLPPDCMPYLLGPRQWLSFSPHACEAGAITTLRVTYVELNLLGISAHGPQSPTGLEGQSPGRAPRSSAPGVLLPGRGIPSITPVG